MTKLIDDLTEWLQEKVCDKLEFKKASIKGDASYKYELVHPTAFSCSAFSEHHSVTLSTKHFRRQ